MGFDYGSTEDKTGAGSREPGSGEGEGEGDWTVMELAVGLERRRSPARRTISFPSQARIRLCGREDSSRLRWEGLLLLL